MLAGRELDCLIHANIFHPEVSFDYKPQKTCFDCDADTVNCQVPRYSTEIGAAWQVVEKMRPEFLFDLTWWHKGEVQIRLYRLYNSAEHYEASAPTAPLAICLAALKAVGYEPKETL